MPLLPLKKTFHFLKSYVLGAWLASQYYGHPGRRLQIYGLTGTDGKTTSATLLYHVLKTAGYKVALISTVAAYIGDEEIDTGFHTTSPEPWAMQRLLKRCVDEGVEHVVLEVTSHGIFQYRVAEINFALAGLTNITREHLDYFGTWDKLVAVKTQLLTRAQQAVINADDASYPLVRPILHEQGRRYATYRQKLGTDRASKAIKARFPESYNRWNANLVRTMAHLLRVSDQDFVAAVTTFPGVKGRMEQIANKRGIHVVVDFAHTPNALKQALRALRARLEHSPRPGRLIAVFGSAGLRDHLKRPAMGQIGAEFADLAVFTAEDPRTEDVNVIIRQMKEGVPGHLRRKIVSIPDRRAAITWAITNAKKGDIIGIFGKGHEQSMNLDGRQEIPWSDQAVVREVVENLDA